MSDIRAVLFDLDGTLIDTHDLILTSMRHAAAKVLSRPVSDEELMALVGQPLETQMLTLALGDERQGEELTRVYRAFNETIHDEWVKPFPGIADMLEGLSQAGLPLGVVTSKRHILAQRGLDVTGLAPYFSELVGPDDWPEHKPQPGPVLYGCKLLGVEPGHCLYVGDSPFDMQAGMGAGCVTVAALWGMFDAALLKAQGPAAAIDHPLDLLPLCKE